MSPTFLKGYKQSLGLKDLPTITKKLNVSSILSTFLGNYKSNKKEEKKEEGGKTKTSTLTVLAKSFGGSFAFAALLRLLNDILLYMTPHYSPLFNMILVNKGEMINESIINCEM